MFRAWPGLLGSKVKTVAAVSFTLRWLIIPYTTFGSVELSFGSERLLTVFGPEKVGPWTPQQTSGLLFVLGAGLMYGMVVMFELFQDLLAKKSAPGADFSERRAVFYSQHWKSGRRLTFVMAVTHILMLVVAVLVLLLSYRGSIAHEVA